jgi:hypothetical protein
MQRMRMRMRMTKSQKRMFFESTLRLVETAVGGERMSERSEMNMLLQSEVGGIGWTFWMLVDIAKQLNLERVVVYSEVLMLRRRKIRRRVDVKRG